MIYLYSGTPGSGKSLHVARDIYFRLRYGRYRNVIANFPINLRMIKGENGKDYNFIYRDNSELTVSFLIDYALKNHRIGIEGQCLVVIDEAQVLFNARDWNLKNRMEWVKFFTQHRKFGYNFILIAQFDRMLDRQIRSLIEYEVKHRKVNNFKIGRLIPFPLFVAVTYWYGVREKIDTEFFIYRRKWSKFYDSFGTFSLDVSLMQNARLSEGE